MFNKLKIWTDFIENMGSRYIGFRVIHALKSKTGFYKRNFPVNESAPYFISLAAWKEKQIPFLIESKESVQLKMNLSKELESRFRESGNGVHTFFNHIKLPIDQNNPWFTNPETGYKYDPSVHWSEIEDYSKKAGDIKYVWERARFSHIYDLIRYDFHSGLDQFDLVFDEIEHFIDTNPVNLGPQYKCSQEISLRILNWTYALYYFKNNTKLSDATFQKIISAIYFQLKHVADHINFSRIAVRNNHAITETLILYLSGLLFPFFPESKVWSKKGEKWFEQEVAYQIYEDGTFLQHSMNYHRVVVQLLTWAIRLNDLNDLRFHDTVYEKAKKSLKFLDTCLDKDSGKLPNYGSNDGALFFKFTDLDYRDYTSQLDDLRMALNGTAHRDSESFAWYGMGKPQIIDPLQNELSSFPIGGYYVINENRTKTLIKCGAYLDRPAQADNLHMDLWVDGVNYLWDCGSYKYNTDSHYLKHFMGTAGHNTVTVNGENQMLKGGRFIWFYWVKKAHASLSKNDKYEFDGFINAFRHIGTIKHQRRVTKMPNNMQWEVTDKVGNLSQTMIQNWHVNPAVFDKIKFEAIDGTGKKLDPIVEEKWMSSYYGVKEPSFAIRYETEDKSISTKITIQA